MTTTPQTGRTSALDELRAAYHEQLTRLAAERDAARRQARRAQAQADVARADLASLQSRVGELLNAAARHLPDLPPVDGPDTPELPSAQEARALPAAPVDPDPEPAAETGGKSADRAARAA